jgi:hypothetical protein
LFPIEKPAMSVKPANRTVDTPRPTLFPRHAAQAATIAKLAGMISGSGPSCDTSENDRYRVTACPESAAMPTYGIGVNHSQHPMTTHHVAATAAKTDEAQIRHFMIASS